jgi:hypothetical protein
MVFLKAIIEWKIMVETRIYVVRHWSDCGNLAIYAAGIFQIFESCIISPHMVVS